jgi:hypothetical protein
MVYNMIGWNTIDLDIDFLLSHWRYEFLFGSKSTLIILKQNKLNMLIRPYWSIKSKIKYFGKNLVINIFGYSNYKN